MARYHDNAYVKKFTTTINEILEYENGFGLVLDETYFYPKSGGQLADRGKINDIEVLDVLKQDNKIIHFVKYKPESKKVECYIDWKRRYDFMQQHSGQHLLSAVIDDDYQAKTVSFHMAEDYSYIDIEKNDIDYKTILNIEEKVNSLIWENKVINTFWIDPEKIEEYDIRKKGKYDKKVRIVEIEDVDLSMCGGTHVSEICEIGVLKITEFEKVKDSTYRIYFLCGLRALRYFQKINNKINKLSSILSVQKNDIINIIRKFKNDREDYYNEIENLKEKLIDEKLKFVKEKKKEIIYDIVENLDNNALNYYANQILKYDKKLAVLYDIRKQFLLIKQNDNNYDLNKIGNTLIDEYSAKGGGSKTIFQIVDININNLEKEIIERFFE